MKLRIYLLSLGLLSAVLPAHAMHIMEGYLPLSWCIFWYAVALPFVVLSYKHIRNLVASNPRVRITFALNTAFVFVLSALKLPSVTGSSSHLTGTTLGTLTTGLMSMPLVGFVVLLFQALLLAHGGLSTLGANIFSLAVAGPFVAYLIYQGLRRLGAGSGFSIFVAAALGSLATYTTTSLQLAVVFPDSSGGVWVSFLKFLGIFATTQVPLCIVEGLMTMLVLRLVPNVEVVEGQKGISPMRVALLSLLALLCLALPLLGGLFDFGGGTDDAAGEMITRLNPAHEVAPFLTAFEPNEALEPWLFALQVLIGLLLGAWVVYKLIQKRA